jgi:hypothetical protein
MPRRLEHQLLASSSDLATGSAASPCSLNSVASADPKLGDHGVTKGERGVRG